MKRNPTLCLLATCLMAGFLLAGVPPVQAMIFRDNGTSIGQKEQKEKEKEKEKSRRNDQKPNRVPEGSGRGLLILAAGALGSGVLVWRRKHQGDVS